MEVQRMQLTPVLHSKQNLEVESGQYVTMSVSEQNKYALTILLEDVYYSEKRIKWEKDVTNVAETTKAGSVIQFSISFSQMFDSRSLQNIQNFHRVMNLLLKYSATLQHISLEELLFADSDHTDLREYLTKYFLPLNELESIEFPLRSSDRTSKKRQIQNLIEIIGFMAESHANLNAFQKLKSLHFGIGNEHYTLKEMEQLTHSILIFQNLESISITIEVDNLEWQQIPYLFRKISRLSNLKRIYMHVKQSVERGPFKEDEIMKLINPFAAIAKQIEEFAWDVPCAFSSKDNIERLSEILWSLENARIVKLITSGIKSPLDSGFLSFLRGMNQLERLSINLSKCELDFQQDILEITACKQLEMLHIEIANSKYEDIQSLCEMMLSLQENLIDIKIKFYQRLKYDEVCLLGETLMELNRTKSRALEIIQLDKQNWVFQGFRYQVKLTDQMSDQIMLTCSGKYYPIYVGNSLPLLVSLMKLSYVDFIDYQFGEQQHEQVEFLKQIWQKLSDLKEIPCFIRSICSLPEEQQFNLPILALMHKNCDHLLKISINEMGERLSWQIVKAIKLCCSLQSVKLVFRVSTQAYVDSVFSSSKNLQSIEIEGKMKEKTSICTVRSESMNIQYDQSPNLLKEYVNVKKKQIIELYLYQKLIQPHLSFQKKYSHLDLHI